MLCWKKSEAELLRNGSLADAFKNVKRGRGGGNNKMKNKSRFECTFHASTSSSLALLFSLAFLVLVIFSIYVSSTILCSIHVCLWLFKKIIAIFNLKVASFLNDPSHFLLWMFSKRNSFVKIAIPKSNFNSKKMLCFERGINFA